MKYKVGDKVRIKNLDWYNKSERNGNVYLIGWFNFIKSMADFCGKIVTIKEVHPPYNYHIFEDGGIHYYTDEMIEGLVEEGSEKKLSDGSWRYKNIFDHSQYPQSFECPQGYQFKDENGNVIEAKKIVLEKKKSKYPKTYEECCEILSIAPYYNLKYHTLEHEYHELATSNKLLLLQGKLNILGKLLICRDAYWKIAGEEMGLGKPWKPDNDTETYNFYRVKNTMYPSGACWGGNCNILEFPTAEMRDAFSENFKDLIEECKELL